MAQSGSFTSRALRITFRLLANAFGPSGADTVTLTGLRVMADITQAQFPTGEIATLRIEGLSPDLMNRLSLAAPYPTSQSASEVLVETEEGTSPAALVFQGGVTLAYADYTNAPDVVFMVQAFSTALPNAMAATPTSFRGAVPVATVLATVARKAGLTVSCHRVGGTFHNPYLDGSPGQQLGYCMDMLPMRVSLGRGQLAVWPARMAGNAPLADLQAEGSGALSASETSLVQQAVSVSSETGLIGYPSWSAGGLAVRMLFNPQVSFNSVISLQSRCQPAGWGAQSGPVTTGLWVVTQVRHSLQSETPHGAWFTDIVAQAFQEHTA
ncbi:hypothetical protein HK16_09945 [Acetobacter senegalensis]|uniref:Burkholderia phage Bcep781 gp38 n=2 Tax=Acetobacter TaxID=434 RepID=A0A252EJ45_9PROT|nr:MULTISPECIES: hypothetical protein [Acetobacter]ATJ90555.1 hypothetical protein CIW82_07515 [Acetobacter tropicalis]OUL66471.1 hypothetical protein HK16_09945 [Acetobacter senegalensis]